jgi:hypothetical protein
VLSAALFLITDLGSQRFDPLRDFGLFDPEQLGADLLVVVQLQKLATTFDQFPEAFRASSPGPASALTGRPPCPVAAGLASTAGCPMVERGSLPRIARSSE